MSEHESWVRQWFQKADRDLYLAELGFQSDHPPYDLICFHAQQCVEKYLKGFLTFHRREIERTHDLIVLLDRCSQIV